MTGWPMTSRMLPARTSLGRTAARPISTACLRLPTSQHPLGGAEGSLKRNIYRNPGLIQVDASVLKNTHVPWLGEQGNLTVPL